jgi:hypothetical protein
LLKFVFENDEDPLDGLSLHIGDSVVDAQLRGDEGQLDSDKLLKLLPRSSRPKLLPKRANPDFLLLRLFPKVILSHCDAASFPATLDSSS